MLGFWIPYCGFWNKGTGFVILCQWNLDSTFQSFGFRKLIMDSKAQDRIPDVKTNFSGFRNPNDLIQSQLKATTKT